MKCFPIIKNFFFFFIPWRKCNLPKESLLLNHRKISRYMASFIISPCSLAVILSQRHLFWKLGGILFAYVAAVGYAVFHCKVDIFQHLQSWITPMLIGHVPHSPKFQRGRQ